MKKIWISLLNTDCYIRNDIKERKHGMIIDELKKQGKALLDARRDNFVRQSLLSDEFLNFMQQNKKPFDLLMSYYECAIMEIETKFRVLNHELSLEYDNNPIESIKTRVKSYDSILKKIRRKNIPLNLQAIEENLKDIAGVRVICSFPDDIYKLAESFLKQDDITLIERKDYIKNPKPSGYRSLHLIVQVPIFLQNEKKMVNVEVQFRTILWISGQVLIIRCVIRKSCPMKKWKSFRKNFMIVQNKVQHLMNECRGSEIESHKNGRKKPFFWKINTINVDHFTKCDFLNCNF